MIEQIILNDIKAIAAQARDIAVKELKESLVASGGVNTGKGLNSIEGVLKDFGYVIEVQVFAREYLKYFDRGTPANKIPFNPGSGRKTSKYIDGLTEYWKSKGLNEKEAKSAAFALAHKHKKYGNPLRFKGNGSKFLTSRIKTIKEQVEDLLIGSMGVTIKNYFQKIELPDVEIEL